MKKLFLMISLAVLAVLAPASMALADAAYPYTTPTYIPSAVSPVQNFAAPSTAYTVTLQNGGILGVDINGTCTSLAATVEVTVDGTTWRAVNVYPMATGVIAAAASIVAAGAYRVNVSGARIARVNISALTASCNVSAVVTSGALAPTL